MFSSLQPPFSVKGGREGNWASAPEDSEGSSLPKPTWLGFRLGFNRHSNGYVCQ